MTTTDTPRTDSALVDHMPECSEWSQHYLDLSTFARQLERELGLAKADADFQFTRLAHARHLLMESKAEVAFWKANAQETAFTKD